MRESTPPAKRFASRGRKKLRKFAISLIALPLLGAAPMDRCAELRNAVVPGLEVTTAVLVGDACRIEAVARPRASAAIGIEMWLPASARWSGRYYQMGNGGFAGHIDRATLGAAAARGDVAAATDTGHKGDGFDAQWALGRPDLIEDYTYRSIKITSDAAAALTRTYYGRPAKHRYFMDCSFGGRQALVAASRWPADWDGVIAGAPATDWPMRLGSFAKIQAALRISSGGWIGAERIARLVTVARRACRGAPDCAIKALREACREGRKTACLTAPQEESLAIIESAGYALRDADPSEWSRWIVNPNTTAPSQLTFATQAFRYLLADNPRWSLGDAPVAREDRVALFKVGSLRPFAARGGKVLSYFGGADAVLPPTLALADARRLGATTAFYRLFPAPGMGHCQGGTAAVAFGQSLEAPAPADTAAQDIRRALEAWVENGTAPTAIFASANGRGRRGTTVLKFVDLGSHARR
ncbi:MAG: tannase/feruloyl esterase family alpha/beta hydrolase [Sphingomonas sp.]|uniref:tannase/feruloyl esterase family alpha/beta hydrolase n=1 Tax=Sphingomonas sp. TaxID=28214 RepID=UPI0012138678|nr:tannase/feruloyl esterase family alpha/beta hydrolase [Sphingomonas sp.]THD38403.1 MAG: tannase/feruloyl esterase family alpha/beta hydrolase [Sphingomonas sp.]